MRLKWHAKWRNPVGKGVRRGLPARSSTLTPRGDAIFMSFGFDRLAPPPRGEKLENESHFLRFRSLTRSKPPQTTSASFMGPCPGVVAEVARCPDEPGNCRVADMERRRGQARALATRKTCFSPKNLQVKPDLRSGRKSALRTLN